MTVMPTKNGRFTVTERNDPKEKQTGRTSRPIDTPVSVHNGTRVPVGSGCFKKRSLPTLDKQEEK